MVAKKESSTLYSVPNSGWIDVSWPLRKGMRKWPEDAQPIVDWILERSKGDRTDMIGLNIITHTGTHMDAPLHFIPKGKTIDTMPADVMVGPGRVIEIKNPEKITLAEVEPYNIQAGERILFKTQNSYKLYDTDAFSPKYVYITIDVAHYLRDRKVLLVGLDYIALGPFADPFGKSGVKMSPKEEKEFQEQTKEALNITSEVHLSFLGNGIWVLESINLRDVRPGPCLLACLPLRVEGGDAAPARCIIRPL
jgi:arylformamidase